MTDDPATGEIERWHDRLTTRARSSGLTVVDRTPLGGGAQPVVLFASPEDDDDFFALLTALQPRVLYAELLIWDGEEIQEFEKSITVDNYLDDLDAFDEDDGDDQPPGVCAERDELLSRAQEHLNEPYGAALVFIADGVQHHLLNFAAWQTALSAEARATATRIEAATHEVHAERHTSWVEQRDRERVVMEQLQPSVQSLEGLLRTDEAFLGGGGSDTFRRQYAQQVFRTQTGWTDDLPVPIRGAVSAAAESAWRWWRAEGKPARVAGLRDRLLDLAGHDTLSGTLTQRRRGAQALLTALDPLGITADLVDELARASASIG